MHFKIFGKQVKVGQSFTKYAELNLFDAVTKFFPNAVSSIVSVSKKKQDFLYYHSTSYYKKNGIYSSIKW